MREILHSFIVAICLITTIFLIARIDGLDGFALWATLIAAAMTNTVVTGYILYSPVEYVDEAPNKEGNSNESTIR